ncbi:MAG: DNA primase [Patescibacteria group bacterium]
MDTTVEQIKARIDVTQLVGGYLKLDKAGVNFKARCPFHNEKSPSFFVSPARGTWHCFGCGRGGDIFSFLMEYEHIEFPEALKILADKTGVVIKRERPEVKERRVRLLELMEEAAKFYEVGLRKMPDVVIYLKKRGLTGETAKTFRIGFAPDAWRELTTAMISKGYSYREMEDVGLVIRKDTMPKGTSDPSGYYDRFRSRVIFPLIDTAGRVVGFGGRAFGKSEEEVGAKYINSPQTELYDKSRFLYNFGRAKDAMRSARVLVVTEGYFDVALSHQVGVQNVVSVSGTALTGEHLTAVKRLADKVLFAFDMDSAGISAAARAVRLAASLGIESAVIELPNGKDPADVASGDAEGWKEAVANARESIAFFLDRAIEKYGVSTGIAKRHIGTEVLPLVARIASNIEQAHWVRKIASTLGISEESCWNELTAYRAPVTGTESVEAMPEQLKHTRSDLLEARVIALLLALPKLQQLDLTKILPPPELFGFTLFQPALAAFQNRQQALLELSHMLPLLSIEGRQLLDRALFELDATEGSLTDPQGELSVTVAAWRAEAARAAIQSLRAQLGAATKESEQEVILARIKSLTAVIASAANAGQFVS